MAQKPQVTQRANKLAIMAIFRRDWYNIIEIRKLTTLMYIAKVIASRMWK